MVHLSHILFRKELNGLKILILSCDTGEGHNSAGKAIKEAAEHSELRCADDVATDMMKEAIDIA